MTRLQRFEKFDIAVALLETAMNLYEKEDYFSALHLAGASEEIFGKHLNEKGIEHSLSSDAKLMTELCNLLYGSNKCIKSSRDFIVKSKNAIKHMNDKNDSVVYLDPEEEARAILIRAFTNLWRMDELTPAFQEFWEKIERRC